ATLAGSDLGAASFVGTDLTGADLRGADLSYCRFVGANLEGADLTGCTVYGVAVWNTQLADARQRDLLITERGEAAITVDDIEVAQFVHLLLNKAKLGAGIDTVNTASLA